MSPKQIRIWLGLGALLGAICAAPIQATARGNTCDEAAIQAAHELNIPTNIMRALTRLETGRRIDGALQPWPWTVNMEGDGHWFDTEDAARSYVFKHFKLGKRSFDVGCFQINYRWHGQAFRSVDEMFDPAANARYAGQFLQSLYEEKGNWEAAVGAYHSRTPKYANRYLAKYQTIHANLPPVRAAKIDRANGFPLLTSGAQMGGNGSLMPNTAGAAPLFAMAGRE
ncbi:transglycosylase SLT domain-containing protein [Pseudoprimorskyibacter insulae]|uniref:Transglycosylase SLT domain-containing protein n=1 Tax=Pseudoprimorskyibacter insulae TaxID=1695997 RepID=A0A2R8AZF2_9RHOB|nr:transglycosylase SLT domain-containing protein [Pseudoprimorskyibacter insulae]SPF81224.1 hypothetical protein PRI8871_03046 [Pseudoprimorskyibacter insulae]